MERGPQRIGDVLAQLVGRGRLGQLHAAGQWEDAWRQVAGPVASRYTRVACFRRGVLEVVVASSTVLQELSFRRQELIAGLAAAVPEAVLRDVRFRLGAIQ